jgi:hypothetical protein
MRSYEPFSKWRMGATYALEVPARVILSSDYTGPSLPQRLGAGHSSPQQQLGAAPIGR